MSKNCSSTIMKKTMTNGLAGVRKSGRPSEQAQNNGRALIEREEQAEMVVDNGEQHQPALLI